MKRLLAPALALLALAAPALAQTRALPPGEIRSNGDITFGNALKLGKREAGKTIITPDSLQILGPGSTGDATEFTARLPGGVVGKLADLFNGQVSAAPYLVGKTGTAEITAGFQAAITAVAEQGRALLLPPGDYTVCGLTFNASKGGQIIASPGTVRLKACAINTRILTVTNMQVNRKPVTIQGLGFDGNGLTGGVGIYAENPAFLNIKDIHTHFIDYATLLTTTAANLGRAEMISIDGLTQWGQGSIAFRGENFNNLLFAINISNVRHFSLVGGSPWVAPWFHFKNVINVVVNNINSASLDGNADGIVAEERVEGVFVSNAMIVWPKIGVKTTKLAGITAPGWIFLNNVAIDQPKVSGFDIESYAFKYTNGNITFGKDQNNTGPGGIIRAATEDWTLSSVQIYGNNYDGLVVEPGAKKGSVSQSGLFQNAVKGSGFDLNMPGASARDPLFGDGNHIGTTSVQGQYINEGKTSRFLALDRLQSSTPNSNADFALKQYAIPANTIPRTGTIRAKASGMFAANARSKVIAWQIAGLNLAAASGAYNGLPWTIEMEIEPIGAAAWVTAKVIIGSNVAATYTGLLSIDTSVSQTIKVIGANLATDGANTAGDVTCGPFSVELVL